MKPSSTQSAALNGLPTPPLPAEGVAGGAAEIRRKSVSGGAITLLAQAATIGLQLVSTVIMARLLGPEEYGILAMATAFTAFAGIFRDLGLSSSTIQSPTLTHEQLSTLFWVNVGAGAVLSGLVALAAPLVAWFYGRAELTAVTLALSLTFVLSSLGTQQGALMMRRMQFGKRAVATVSGAVMGLGAAIMLALQGFGYWALVGSTLVATLTSTLLLNLLSEWRPGLPSRHAGIRSMLKFGANITGFEFVNYFARNLDNILIGRFWGADALGLYSRAYQLLMLPITNLRGPIQTVAFPAMSRLQGDPVNFRTYYRRVTALLAFVSMPLTAFLLVAAHPVIHILLGPRWQAVAPIFMILAITAFIQPVASLRGLVLLSSGRGSTYLRWGALNALCVSIGFFVGSLWGVIGVAVAYAVVNYLILYPSLVFAFKGTPVRPIDFFQSIARPACASITTAAAIYGGLAFSKAPQSLAGTLVAGGAFFALYALVFFFMPGGRHELCRHRDLAVQLKQGRSGRAG